MSLPCHLTCHGRGTKETEPYFQPGERIKLPVPAAGGAHTDAGSMVGVGCRFKSQEPLNTGASCGRAPIFRLTVSILGSLGSPRDCSPPHPLGFHHCLVASLSSLSATYQTLRGPVYPIT
jgi:hypothetical protein